MTAACNNGEKERVAVDEVEHVEFGLRGRHLRVTLEPNATAGARARARRGTLEFACIDEDETVGAPARGRFDDDEASVRLPSEPRGREVTCFVEVAGTGGEDVAAASFK